MSRKKSVEIQVMKKLYDLKLNKTCIFIQHCSMCVAVSNSGWALRKPQKVIPHLLNPVGFPDGTSGKESACQCRRHKRCGFNPWVRKIPWRKKWQPTPVFLPGESYGQRSLAGYSPWGRKQSEMTEMTTHAWGTVYGASSQVVQAQVSATGITSNRWKKTQNNVKEGHLWKWHDAIFSY